MEFTENEIIIYIKAKKKLYRIRKYFKYVILLFLSTILCGFFYGSETFWKSMCIGLFIGFLSIMSPSGPLSWLSDLIELVLKKISNDHESLNIYLKLDNN
jgi:hypothetical protein